MAQDEFWKTGGTPVENSAGGDWWKTGGTPVDDEKPKRTWGEAIKDTGAQLAEGVNTTIGAIPNLVAPDSGAAGFFRENAEYWREAQSDPLKQRIAASDEKIRKAGEDGIGSQIGEAASEYWNDPAQAARLVATNIPSMIPGLGAGKLAQGAAIAKGASLAKQASIATGTAAAVNSAMNAGGARGEAFDDLQRSHIAQGATPDAARESALSESLLPAAVGGVAGAVSGKIGLEKALLGQVGAGSAVRGALRSAGAEIAGEQVEEVAPKIATNLQVGRIDAERGALDDVGRTMVETTIGAGPGAIAAGGFEAARTPGKPAAIATPAQSAGAKAFAAGQPMTPPADIKSVAAKAEFVRDWQNAAAASMTTTPGAAGQGEAAAPSGDVLPEVPGGMAGVQRTFDPRAGGKPPISMLQTDAGGNAIDFEASPEFDRSPREFQPLKENEPTRALGFNPLAGTPRVFPDGTVSLGSDQDEFTKFVPSRATQIKRSEQMGLNPAAGPMSAAAATAVDSGAADQVQQQTAMAQAAEVAAQEAKKPAKKYAHRVNGTLDGKPFQTMVMAASTDEAMVSAVKASPGLQPSSAEPVSKSAAKPATSGETTLEPQAIEPVKTGAEKPQAQPAAEGVTDVANQTKAAASMAQAGKAGPANATGQMVEDQADVPASTGIQGGLPATANLKPPRGILAKKAEADAARAARTADDQAIKPASAADAEPVAAPAARSAGVSGVDEQGAIPALSNVKDAPQAANDGQAKAARGEARAPEGGDVAAAEGVPAAPGAGDVQTDGVKRSKNGYAEVRLNGKKHVVTPYDDYFVIRDADGLLVRDEENKTLKFKSEPDAIQHAERNAKPKTESDAIAEAAHQAATSPKNDLPQPTEAQKEAGNYVKGHVTINGHGISIENPAGSKRRQEWPALKNHYGYFKGSVGADKDHVDLFMTDRAGDASLPVFVVDQTSRDGTFDEHKIIMGTADESEARATYLQNYEKGWTGLGAITQMTQDEFKAWVRDPAKTKKPVALKRGVLAKMAEQKAKAARRKSEDIRDSRWESMNLSERERVAEAIGRKGIFAQKLAEKRWDRIDAEVKVKLREVLDALQPAAVPAGNAGNDSTTQPQPKPETTAKAPPAEPVKPEPAPQPKAEKPAEDDAKPAQKTAEKIEDFGEKLAGARKDYAATLKDAMSVDVAAEPLSKSWPEPDYQKLLDGGADPFIVSWVHAARDEIPTKPQTSWKLSGWVKSVDMLRKVSSQMLSGEVTKERLQEMLEKPEYSNLKRQLGGRAELYQAVGHGKSLKGITFMEHHYSVYRDEKNVTNWSVEMKAKSSSFGGWPREIAVADTKADALAQFKSKYASLDSGPKGKGKSSFVIYRKRGEPGAFIGKKIGREYIDLHKAEDVKAARAYLADNTDKLEKALERYKDTPYERGEENAPRVGDDHRNGAPVTPEVFGQTFGFRGVQFGNYVEQGRRQSDLNEAFDALMDMAAVLGIPPKAISLNGRLGLAFGARGKGGKNAPAAHYEAGNVVINLTKGGGPGSLAHEWFHAMDNYFAKQGGGVGYMTDGADGAALREEMRQAFKAVKTAVNTGALKLRSLELDKRRTKPYWSTPIEMAARSFESYVVAKLQDQNASNDYLANVVNDKVWEISEAARAEFFTGKQASPSYPYPTVDELPVLRAAFDDFFKVVQTRETESGSVELFNQRRGADAPTEESAAVQSAIEGKSLVEAAQFVADTGSAAQREVAAMVVKKLQAMQEAGVNLELKVAHRGEQVPQDLIFSRGYTEIGMDAKGRDVVVWLNGADVKSKVGTDYETLLHELVHAATAGAMRHAAFVKDSPYGDALKSLDAAAQAIGDHITNRFEQADAGDIELTEFEQDIRAQANNAFTSLDEVVSWALTSREAQEYLDGIPYKSGSLWTRFVRAVRSALGLSEESDTVLSEVLRAAEKLMNPQDEGIRFMRAMWHKRGIMAGTQQAKGSVVFINRNFARSPATESTPGNAEANYGTRDQAQGTTTDRAVMAMASEGKSADEILRFIASASKSKFNRQMANLLRRTKANPTVSIGGEMGGGAGFKFLAKYSRKNHEVTLSEAASGKAEQILLHEMVHAATLLALDRGGEHAARMKALYESVKAQGLSDAYGMKNVGEFVAEAFTNPEFQKLLKGYKTPGGTAWDRFVAAVRRILGLSDQSQDALSAALGLGVEVMRENVPLRKARSFSAEDAPEYFGMADAASLKNSALEQIKQFDVKTAPKNTWAHYRGMAMQALGRRQIVDLYAEELPQLEHYNDLVQRMDAEKNESGAEADNLAQEWGKLKNGEDRALAELMHDATLAQMDPSKAQEPGTLTIQYKALEARYKALTPDAKALFGKARDMYKAHYTAVQKAIKERIERSEMSDGQKRQIMARMDEELFKELKGVYFPLARFGQYVIVVKDANGEVKNVTRSETVKEAEAARKELQKAFPAHMGNTVGKVLKQAEFNAGRDAVGKGFMADLMGALDNKGVDDELRDTVAQLYLSSLPDLSWAKHGIHRKGTPGFSQDARRAFAQNMFHGARYLAKLRYADQLQDQLTAMQDHIKAYESVEEYDSVEAQQVVDEMVKRHEFMMNPKSSPVSTALTSFGFLFHMGLSPASAMVNLTQTALVAFPQMGAKWGFGKASAALIKASEETVRAKNDLSKVLKGDELDALNKAINDGTIDVTMAHDLAGISQGEDQGVMWKVRPVMRAASFMFHHAEKFNRQATFLAAYRLAKEANPTRTFDRLYEDAQKATYDGHFDYSAGNRPRFMQGNWQKVIFLFKQYSTNMLYTLSRNAYQSVKALDPKERAQARKTLAGLLVAHAAAAGVLGLPIVGQLLTIASFLGSDDDEPWDAEVAMQNAMAEMLGPKAAEVMARGLSRLTPWDLSGRVALNKLILPDVQEGLEGKAWAESAMAAALGPVAGIGVNVARGMQKITDGDYMRGIEDMLPTALRGPIKAMRYAQEGAVDKTGIVITDEVSAAGILGQASGFSPSQVRRDTERRSAIYSYDKALTDRRSVLMRMFADAQMNGDTETVQNVRQDIAAFNEKNPTRRITVPNLMQSVRNRQRRIDQAQDGIYLPKNRRDALDAVTF